MSAASSGGRFSRPNPLEPEPFDDTPLFTPGRFVGLMVLVFAIIVCSVTAGNAFVWLADRIAGVR